MLWIPVMVLQILPNALSHVSPTSPCLSLIPQTFVLSRFGPPQLSLRRQQVSEKLNEWAVFNEKNKELCEWLTQMESKVSQNGDISIEEMIEKLRKVIWEHDPNRDPTWNTHRRSQKFANIRC